MINIYLDHSSFWGDVFKEFLGGCFAGYFLIIISKFICVYLIRKFLSFFKKCTLYENGSDEFELQYSYWNFITPLPCLKIKIIAKTNSGEDNWKGSYVSDILNPWFFKGTYVTKTYEQGLPGYHELTFLEKENKEKENEFQIAVRISYLKLETINGKDKLQWKDLDGYYMKSNVSNKLQLRK